MGTTHTLIVLMAIIIVGGYLAFHAIKDRLERIEEDIADLTKDLARVGIDARGAKDGARSASHTVGEIYSSIKERA